MNQPSLLKGGCYCGKVRIAFGTSKSPTDLIPRVCDCAFCSKHGASYISDPDGSLAIQAKGLDTLSEYRHGAEIARFLMCRSCGVLVAVVFDDGAASYGTLNVRCLEDPVELGPPQVVSPRKFTPEEKRRRWARLWTPGVQLSVFED